MTAGSRRRSGRGPGTLYAAAATVVFVVLSVMALTPPNPTPPAIAEFAPQPREQIKDAPAEQSSEFGSGEGGDVGTAVASRPSLAPASASPIATPSEQTPPPQARVRRCVGDPPRQTEDPQSPPCVAFWGGTDNGGATSKGVTRDTIRVAVPFIKGQDGEELGRQVTALVAFFNARFEFYGRKLELVKYIGQGEQADPKPARQKADAVLVDEQIRAFASMPYADQVGADFYYYDELSRRHIVGIYPATGTSHNDVDLQKNHPYQWGVVPTTRRMSDSLGEWVCTNLAGRTASWAGNDLRGRQRTFAMLITPTPDGSTPDIDPLRKRLSACGVGRPDEVHIPAEDPHSAARTAVLRLKQDGITTVLPWSGGAAFLLSVLPAADEVQYTPEWVISSYLGNDADVAGLLAPGNQLIHTFGPRFINKNQLPADRPGNWAMHEMDPDAGNIDFANEKYVYQPLMILASGIQAAGPNLTPQTFGAALQQLQFPNPSAGAAPWYQAHVGFAGDHTWFNDATPVWWSPDATSREQGTPSGAYCYVDRGRRFALGAWPSKPARLFDASSPCY